MIPFAKPFLGKEEINAVKQTILSAWITQGPKVKQFEDAFSSYVGTKYACAVSSCTSALHLALITVGVKLGNVVITVSHSFIATANSVRHCGAEPVFIDIDLDTYNISAESLERFLNKDCEIRCGRLYYKKFKEIATEESPLRYFLNVNNSSRPKEIGRIAAILPVHQIGMPCDLNTILPLARKFNLPVIEDAACALGSEIKISSKWERIGKPHGDIACFSFHPRKIITAGEGGMITTNNSDYDKKVRLLRHHGMSIPDTVRHNAKKVIFEKYIMTGYNYRMTDIQAAIGIEQLKKMHRILSERRKIAVSYYEELKDISWLKLTKETDYSKTNWQSYPVRVLGNAPLGRDKLMQYLLDAGISTRRGIMNAHQEKIYAPNTPLKNSELARDSVILLPIFNGMKETHIKKVVKLIKNV